MGWTVERMEKAISWAVAEGDTELYDALLRKKKRLEVEAAVDAQLRAAFQEVKATLKADFDELRDRLELLHPPVETENQTSWPAIRRLTDFFKVRIWSRKEGVSGQACGPRQVSPLVDIHIAQPAA